MHDHVLLGCRTKPLSNYLKAIAVLRLVAEQKDSRVKGFWQGKTFAIRTELKKEELEAFFCEEYSPTPIVSPWNGGSGFYLGDSVDGIAAISNSEQRRFKEYREIISRIKHWPEIPRFDTVKDVCQMLNTVFAGTKPGKKKDELVVLLTGIEEKTPEPDDLEGKDPSGITLLEIENLSKAKNNPNKDKWADWWRIMKKARTKCNSIKRNDNKKNIMPLSRARLPDLSIQWLDAVFSLQKDGQPSLNRILGSGGNEGRLELSNNFMQRLAGLFLSGDLEKTRALFQSAAFGTILSGLVAAKIGQYNPGRAGGYNQGMEIQSKEFKINPWDYILAIEGALMLAGAAVRRNPTDNRSQFTSPFTVRFSPVGFSSSASEEVGPYYETWLPIWRNPASYKEVRYLFSEGRSSVGRRISRTGVDFARAVGTLGVDRGITAFERYAFLQRRGQSNVALPAGRMKVRYSPSLDLLNELDPISWRVDQFLRGFKDIPATFKRARRRIDQKIFSCTQNPDVFNFSHLIRAVGQLEKLIALRDRSLKPGLTRPLFGLSPRWIERCDDGGTEVRIAAALASIRATGMVGPLRSNMAGVSASNPTQWSKSKVDRCWFGSSIAERLAGVLSRRQMDAERNSLKCIPIEASLPVCAPDIMPFLWGECDDEKLEELLWGFTLINWKKSGLLKVSRQWKTAVTDRPLSRTWCLIKLLHSPEKIRGVLIKKERRITGLLMAGRIAEACEVGIHRLMISDLHPFNVSYSDDLDPIRLLATLLIPVNEQQKLEPLVLENKPETSK